MSRRAASLPPEPVAVLALGDGRRELVARAPEGHEFSAGVCEQLRRYVRGHGGDVVASSRLIRATMPSAEVETTREYLGRVLALAAASRVAPARATPADLTTTGYTIGELSDRAVVLIRRRPGMTYAALADALDVPLPIAQHVAEQLIADGRARDREGTGRRQA